MMRNIVKAIALLLALALLLTGCQRTVDFRDGHWRDREDVLFVTAMETGFYLFREADQIACTMDFVDGWIGTGTPDDGILAGNEYAFTAAGYMDILEPHEGTKPEDIYETAFLFYMVYNEDTKGVSAMGGYMDEGIDDTVGVIDADVAAGYIDLFYNVYDKYMVG